MHGKISVSHLQSSYQSDSPTCPNVRPLFNPDFAFLSAMGFSKLVGGCAVLPSEKHEKEIVGPVCMSRMSL